MTRDLRIVFMGTPDFAVATLKHLIEHQYHVVGVITAPDKPAGRGRKIQESAVKAYAKSQGLHIMQPTNLKSDNFLTELKSLDANLQIVVAFRMLPEAVWRMPEYGTFNLHASLLPNYRGAAPINWAIMNGETQTGVSTFFIDEHIDTGEMILQKEVDIAPTEDAGSLHDRLMEIGSRLVLDTVKLIEQGHVTTTPQPEQPVKTAYKLNRENCRISWDSPINDIYNMIRGLSPYPAAWTMIQDGEELIEAKLYKTEKQESQHNHPIGLILSNKKELKIAVREGYLNILEIKLSGKKKMDAPSLLNGFSFSENAKVL